MDVTRRVRVGVLSLVAAGCVLWAPAIEGRANGQDQGQAVGRPEWVPAVRHDTSRPLRDMPARPPVSSREDFDVRQGPPIPRSAAQTDTTTQSIVVAPLAATPGASFDGVGEGHSQFNYNVNYAPPDTVGEAGLTEYVQWVNPSFAVFDKGTGQRLYGPAAGNTIWTGFGGECESRNDGDPIVQFDQLANRWIMTQFAVRTGAYRQCVAISQTESALGAWHRYEFSYADFPDYPKLSVWPDAYYVTFNMFSRTTGRFTATRVCAYDRAQMLQGLPATQICHESSTSHSMLAADLDGTTLPPPGTPNYIMNIRTDSSLNLWRFTPNFSNGTSTFTGPQSVPVAPFSIACSQICVPQPSTSQKLDVLGDRLMYRLSYRNLGDRASLLVNHSVAVNSVIGVRWYEIDITNNTPTVRQQSTYAPNDGQYRWMGSLAMDKVGNIALGYSISSTTMRPSIRFVGREATDPLNTLSNDTNLWSGTGSQLSNLSRWGDYSTMAIDPVDDCTFWFTTEYLKTNGTFNWSTRVGSFKFPSCGSVAPTFGLDVAPSSRSVVQGQSTTFDVTVTSQNGYTGAGSYLASGLPDGATAEFNGSGYSNGAGTSTMTVQTSASTPPGTYQVVVTATDSAGAPSKSSTVSLTVTAAPVPTFSLSATPSSRTILQGQSASFSATVTAQNGYGGSGSFSVTGLPAGVTGSFSPTGFTGSGSTTLTIPTTSQTTPGTYQLTITAEDSVSGITRTAPVTLVVNPEAAADFSFSASPSQLVVKRGRSGNYTLTVTATGGFDEPVTFGVTGLPTGVTAVFTPGTLSGSGTATLSLTVPNQVAKGNFALIITASSASFTRNVNVVLKVN